MRMTRSTIKAAHVRQVDAARKAIADAAAKLIRAQLASAANELEAGGIATGAAIFKPRDWDERLKAALGPAIGRVMLLGAASELARQAKASTATQALEQYGIDLGDDIATEMPQAMIDRIEAALADSFARPYWASINGTTRAHLESILRHGTTQGLSIRDLAKAIRDTAPGYSKARATAIARTESSRSLNAGHVEGIAQLEADTGEPFGKEWLSILGTTTRPAHAALDGATAATGEPFYLDGSPCQFPSDPDLPPEQSINCLCTITAGLLG